MLQTLFMSEGERNPAKSSSKLDSVENGQIQNQCSVHPIYEQNVSYSQYPYFIPPVYDQNSIMPVYDLHAPYYQYHYPAILHDPNHHLNP
jgi:hypothetical protein